MNNAGLDEFLGAHIEWHESGDPLYPLKTRVNGKELVLRINDFPTEPLYTLFVNKKETGNIEDFPPTWKTMPTKFQKLLRLKTFILIFFYRLKRIWNEK